MLTNLSSNRINILVFVRPVSWRMNVCTAPTIRKVINEVNNNNRNKISWKFNLINYFRVVCACQHCQTKIRWTKKRNGVQAVDLWIFDSRRPLRSSHHRICWKGYPCDNFIYFFQFLKIRLRFGLCLCEDGHWHSLQVHRYMCIRFQRTNSLMFISKSFDVCVNSRRKRENKHTHVHFNLRSSFSVLNLSVKCLSFTSLFAKWLLTLAANRILWFFFESHSSAVAVTGTANAFESISKWFSMLFGQFELIDWLTLIDNRFQNILSESKMLEWQLELVVYIQHAFEWRVCVCLWIRCTIHRSIIFHFNIIRFNQRVPTAATAAVMQVIQNLNRLIRLSRFDRRHSLSVACSRACYWYTVDSDAFPLRTQHTISMNSI